MSRKGVIVNCLHMEVRKGPSRSSPVLCKLPCMDPVEVLDYYDPDGVWLRIMHISSRSTVIGYCDKKFIAIKD